MKSMSRRKFIKRSTMAAAAAALLPGHLPVQTAKAAAPASSGASGTGKVPEWAGHMLDSDMQGLGPDGKPTGQIATFTGASKANATAEEAAKNQILLTADRRFCRAESP